MRLLLLASLFVFVVSLTLAEEPKRLPLFNGKDLSGWKAVPKDAKLDAKEAWSVLADGTLRCTGKPTGYLITEKEYENYTLRFRWKYTPTELKRPNSGVLIHCQPGDAFWPHSYEAQLAKGNAGDLWFQYDDQKKLPTFEVPAEQRDAANKEGRRIIRIKSEADYEKPVGEWNDYEIVCQGGEIKILVNGKLANHAKNASLKKGKIALQAEGAEIHFREMTIEKLP
ncbi:MAG: 3-keto-disaccharide hydrolase [Fimbriiglobus sp.]